MNRVNLSPDWILASEVIGQYTISMAESPEVIFERLEMAIIIRKVLINLSPLEEEVIRMRFLEEMTDQKTGELLYLSRTRITQIEASALRKLRHPTNGKQLKPLL